MLSIADRNYRIFAGAAIRFLRSNWLRLSRRRENGSREGLKRLAS
jgi:hypothetical protein